MKKLKLLWIFLYFSVVTIIFTYPVAFHLNDSMIKIGGDGVYFIWLIRWYQGVIFEGQGQMFFNPAMNYPEGWFLSTTDTTLASALPGVPFSLLFGPIAGYNIAMLLTFVLSGFFMYLWVRDLTKSEGAALVAGTMFAFLPYRMAHCIVGHLNLSGTQWFPLFFLGLTRLLKGEHKFDIKSILLTAVGLVCIGFTSMYYLYMTLLIGGVFIVCHLVFSRFRQLRSKYFWLNVIAAAVISLPLVYLSIKPFIDLSHVGDVAAHTLEAVSVYSASPTDFFLPASDHFIFGKILAPFLDRPLWIEGSLYIGLSGMVFSIIALLKARKSEYKALIYAAWISLLVAMVLAFGIDLHWNNQHIVMEVPDFLHPFIQRWETYFYLPSYWLFFKLPYYSSMRALMRFGVLTLVFTSMLTGLGFHRLSQRMKGRLKPVLTAFIICFILFEFYPGPYTERVEKIEPREVDLWLAEQPGDGAVVQMPIKQSESTSQIFYTLTHHKPIIGGFFNANQPRQYKTIKPVMENFPDQASVDTLQELGVEFIVVDSTAYEDFDATQKQIDDLDLVLLTIKDNEYVYTFNQ